MQIIIIEPHPLLRLGLAGLMGYITSPDHIKSQSYDDLYHSPPHPAPSELVLLGAHPDERIHLLIQAVRRAHTPRRIVLLSETASPPTSWINLPALVVDYISTASSAEAILSTVQSLVQHKHGTRSPFPSMGHARGFPPSGVIANGHYQPTINVANNMAFKFEVNEARMLGLSTRQYEVLVLLAQGYPVKLICRQLNISMATTKGHLEALYQRLGVHNRNEAVFVALAQGASLQMPHPSHSQV